MNEIIYAEDIVKSFGEGPEKRNVIDGLSMSVKEGEFVSIMGPSGCGKSTLLFALSGMDRPDSGSVIFDGRDISHLNENELADVLRTRMGFVFQQPAFLKRLNILGQHNPAVDEGQQEEKRRHYREGPGPDEKDRHRRPRAAATSPGSPEVSFSGPGSAGH